jgi:hypothetical protein
MRPLAVLNAILFGSAVAIALSLGGVTVVFLILRGRHPEMGAELPTLLQSGLLFAGLAAVSGASLFAMLKGLRWRWLAQGAMWLLVAGMAVFYVRA